MEYIINVSSLEDVKTINEAVNIANTIDENTQVVIKLSDEVYNEKVRITRSNTKIVGANNSIITYNDYAKKIHPKDNKEYNTFRTYTLSVIANNCTLENLTIINSSGEGKTIGQAVSLHIQGYNNKCNNLKLKAFQDTLFVGPLPENLIVRYTDFLDDIDRTIPKKDLNIFTNCYIEGTIDFVFGCGKSYFDNCQFHSIGKGGFVFAPSTYQSDFYGFTVCNSTFTSTESTPSTYIARPWRDYGKVVLINCTYGKHILDSGFDKWNDTNRDKTCRFYEYNCSYLDKHLYTRCAFSKVLKESELSLYTLEKHK